MLSDDESELFMPPNQIDSVLHQVVAQSPELASTTRERYRRDLNVWIVYAGADPRGWTRIRAQEFYNQLLANGLKPQSANRLFASVRYAATWWARRENRPELDFGLIQTANAQGKAEKRAMTPTEAAALLATCGTGSPMDLRDRALIVLGLETGMRSMSLLSMLIETTAITPVAIAKTAVAYPAAWVYMKGHGADRIPVPLSDTAIHALVPWLEWLAHAKQRTGPVFCAIQKRVGRMGHNVFTPSGKPMAGQSIAKIFDARATEAGIVHVHPHMFRHTFVTWRSQAGTPPLEIAAVTGHKVAGLGALGGYVDMRALAERVRNLTPEWLRQLVMGGS